MRRFALIIFLFATRSVAEDLYVAQTAVGGQMTNCATATNLVWLNNVANWGSGANKVSAGDTVHLCGTFTNRLIIAGSGELASRVTILFESGAKFSETNWWANSSFGDAAIYFAAKNYLIFDGGINGQINCTSNGTAQIYQVNSTGLSGTGNGITVRNLTVTNIYNRTEGSTTDFNRMGLGIVLQGSDQLVENCTLTDGDTMLAFGWATGGMSNVMVRQNYIGRCNHGLTIGNYNLNAYLWDVSIYSNRIDRLDVWNGHADLHLDGMIIFNEAADYSGYISNLNVYANFVGPDIGTITTAGFFSNSYRPSQMVNLRIFNNLFTVRAPWAWTGGFLSIAACTNTSLIVNNSFINEADDSTGLGISLGYTGGLGVSNNLFYGVGAAISYISAVDWPLDFRSDYNIFYNTIYPGSGAFAFPPARGGVASYNNWTNAIASGSAPANFDLLNSTRSQPSLDANHVPLSGDTVARGKGFNLTALGIITDFYGNPRPSSGAWTIGAFESSEGGGGGGGALPTLSGKLVLGGQLILQ